jgi:hypothetical protein
VSVTVRFNADSVRMLKELTKQGIRRAFYRAKDRIWDRMIRYTPVRTGRLASSFDIDIRGQSIHMSWDAADPKSHGFHYAKVVEEGRQQWKPFPGRFYAEATKWDAKQILYEELVKELAMARFHN